MRVVPVVAFFGGLGQFNVITSMECTAIFAHGVAHLRGIQPQSNLTQEREIEVGVERTYLLRPGCVRCRR